MAAIKVILFVALVFVLYGETEGLCSLDYECPGIQVCCRSECRFSCATEGEYCYAESSCDDSLHCCDNICKKTCIGQYCSFDSDCGPAGNYCCNYQCRGSCDGQSCSVDRNCGDKKYCCNDICRDSCVGHRCDFNSDCGGGDEYCCNDKCQKGKCSLASWAIVMIVVFSVIGAIAVIAGVAFSYYRSNQRHSPGIIVAAPFTRMPATTVAGTSNVSSYAHLPTQPAFQPGEPSEEPPQQYKL